MQWQGFTGSGLSKIPVLQTPRQMHAMHIGHYPCQNLARAAHGLFLVKMFYSCNLRLFCLCAKSKTGDHPEIKPARDGTCHVGACH